MVLDLEKNFFLFSAASIAKRIRHVLFAVREEAIHCRDEVCQAPLSRPCQIRSGTTSLPLALYSCRQLILDWLHTRKVRLRSWWAFASCVRSFSMWSGSHASMPVMKSCAPSNSAASTVKRTELWSITTRRTFMKAKLQSMFTTKHQSMLLLHSR